MSQGKDKTLLDLGERKLISEVIGDYCDDVVGDDCAAIDIDADQVVITTDPVPPPAARTIGGDCDFYWAGWLLVTINASDLAASAAKPLAFVAAIDAPKDMNVSDLRRLLAGIRDACAEESLKYVGGNLREATNFSAVGTGVGSIAGYRPLTRFGIQNGDLLAVVGAGGEFWSDALLLDAGFELDSVDDSPVFRPRSQSQQLRILHSKGLIRAAMDNSDGLLPTVNQLCDTNDIGAAIDLGKLPEPRRFRNLSGKVEIAHQRTWLGWGDWNVVVAVAPSDKSKFEQVAADNGIDVCLCGEFQGDNSNLTVRFDGCESSAPRLDSERFSRDSWMTSGIAGYIAQLKTIELPCGS